MPTPLREGSGALRYAPASSPPPSTHERTFSPWTRSAAMTMTLDDHLEPLPLVAVLRGITPDEVPAVAEALYAEGFRMLEVTLNSPQPFDSIRRLADSHGSRCLVGAGTVIEVADVARVRDAGGRLIVMPYADTAVIREAKGLGMVCL